MNFDYLRLFLAVTVLTTHLGFATFEAGELWSSELAVLFFFCISGFLITQSYLRDGDLLRYFKRRLARIYPPILATVIVLCAFGLITSQDADFLRGSMALGLFQDWLVLWKVEGDDLYTHGAFWTLVVEAQFYVLLPAGILLWRKRPWTAIWLIGLAYLLAFYGRATLDIRSLLTIAFRDNVLNFAHFFIAGALFAVFAPTVTQSKWFWPVIAPAALALFIAQRMTGSPHLDLLLPFAITIIVLAVARASALLGRSAPWGDLSYGIYLYHLPIMTMLALVLAYDPWHAMILTVAAAFASWHLLEKPALKRATSTRLASAPATPSNVEGAASIQAGDGRAG